MSRLGVSSLRRGGLDRDEVISAAVGCRDEVLRTLRRRYTRFAAMDIEDCVSSAIESLLAEPDSFFDGRFASDGAVTAWLIHAARNDLLNADAKWTRRVVAVDPTAPVTLIDLIGASDVPGPVFVEDEANKANQYVRLIPEGDREIAHLAFFGRLKTAEIADALGMEALAVQRTIDRARKTVRRRLGDEITESRLCELVASDLAVLRATGEFTPELREHIRSCRACELIVADACGRAVRGVLPPVAGGGLMGWVLRHAIRRSSSTATVHAPASSAATVATTGATSTVSGSATQLLAGASAFKAGFVVAAAVVALGGGAEAVRAITHHHPRGQTAHVTTARSRRPVVVPILPPASKLRPTRAVHTKTKAVSHRVAVTTTVGATPVTRTTDAPASRSAGAKAAPTTRASGTALSPTGPVSRVRP